MDVNVHLIEAAILIVDDQPMCVRLLQSMLKRAGYLTLASTTDSREVVQLYREFQPDLLIMDLHMPHLTGFEVMERLREATGRNDLPILAVTADLSPPTRAHALKVGAKMFLTKPFSQSQLVTQASSMLQARLAGRDAYPRRPRPTTVLYPKAS